MGGNWLILLLRTEYKKVNINSSCFQMSVFLLHNICILYTFEMINYCLYLNQSWIFVSALTLHAINYRSFSCCWKIGRNTWTVFFTFPVLKLLWQSKFLITFKRHTSQISEEDNAKEIILKKCTHLTDKDFFKNR